MNDEIPTQKITTACVYIYMINCVNGNVSFWQEKQQRHLMVTNNRKKRVTCIIPSFKMFPYSYVSMAIKRTGGEKNEKYANYYGLDLFSADF